MKMIIADSGATKTDWALIQDGKPVYIRTSGLNPFFMAGDKQQDEYIDELRASFGGFKPDVIRFYGAGCVSEKASAPIRDLLKDVFGDVAVDISDDLSAVAKAYLPAGKRSSGAETVGSHAIDGRSSVMKVHGDLKSGDGVAAILGTGSSSGLFRAGRLIEKVPSLGFILGDEGGAADIARHLLASLLRGAFSPETTDCLESAIGTTDYGFITSQLYGSERPSYWLGTITKQVFKKPVTDEIRSVARGRLQAFTDTHLKAYTGFPDYELVVTGGIAIALKDDLSEVLKTNGLQKVKIFGNVITALAEQQITNLKTGGNLV